MGTTTVRLTVLGCGDAFGSGGRNQTCFHLQGPGGQMLIDCGATSLSAIKGAAIEPNDISAVVISHLHGDHFGGLPFFIIDGHFRHREKPLIVAGPPGIRTAVEAAMEAFFPGSTKVPSGVTVEFVELSMTAPTPVAAALVTAHEVELPGTPACCLRVEVDGCTIAYSGDTAWSEDLPRIADGADIFLAEAYFYDLALPDHMSFASLAANVASLTCERIVLTHMSPDMLSREVPPRFERAEDGLVLTIDPATDSVA